MDGLKAELICLMSDVNEFYRRLAAPDFLPSTQAVRTIRIAIRDSLHGPTHPVQNLVEPSVGGSPAGQRLRHELLSAWPTCPPLASPSSSLSSTPSTPLSTPDQLTIVPQSSLPDNSAVPSDD